jgi:hypothetical protein
MVQRVCPLSLSLSLSLQYLNEMRWTWQCGALLDDEAKFLLADSFVTDLISRAWPSARLVIHGISSMD